MKKAICTILAMVMLLSVFTGCTYVPYTSRDTHLFTVAAYNTLGFGGNAADTWVMEKDTYGRILFRFSYMGAGVFGDTVKGYGICQKHSGSYTYYYEDDCILFCDEDYNVDPEALENLKRINDWDKELRDDLMRSAKNIRWDNQKVERDCSLVDYAKAALPIAEDRIWDWSIICSDTVGKQLIIMRQCDSETDYVFEDTTCAVIVYPDGSIDTENGIIKLEDAPLNDYTDIIKAFKKANNWNKIYHSAPADNGLAESGGYAHPTAPDNGYQAYEPHNHN